MGKDHSMYPWLYIIIHDYRSSWGMKWTSLASLLWLWTLKLLFASYARYRRERFIKIGIEKDSHFQLCQFRNFNSKSVSRDMAFLGNVELLDSFEVLQFSNLFGVSMGLTWFNTFSYMIKICLHILWHLDSVELPGEGVASDVYPFRGSCLWRWPGTTGTYLEASDFAQCFVITTTQYTDLGGGFKYFLNFHPYLGKISILINIFQMGWNHQLVLFAVSQYYSQKHSTVWYLISKSTIVSWSLFLNTGTFQVWSMSSVWSSTSSIATALVSWTCWVSSVHVAYWDRRDSWIEDDSRKWQPKTPNVFHQKDVFHMIRHLLLKYLVGLLRQISRVTSWGLSFEELRKIFETLDKDGSGAIDFLEFLTLGGLGFWVRWLKDQAKTLPGASDCDCNRWSSWSHISHTHWS